MTQDHIMRKQLQAILGGEAHISFEQAISDFPLKEINRKLPDGSYTPWHLLEHMRIAQWDIVEYILNPEHVSPEFPGGYWPKPDETATVAKWKKTIQGIQTDLKRMQKLVKDPKTKLFAPLPANRNHTIFREALLVADHNAYHTGELTIFKRLSVK